MDHMRHSRRTGLDRLPWAQYSAWSDSAASRSCAGRRPPGAPRGSIHAASGWSCLCAGPPPAPRTPSWCGSWMPQHRGQTCLRYKRDNFRMVASLEKKLSIVELKGSVQPVSTLTFVKRVENDIYEKWLKIIRYIKSRCRWFICTSPVFMPATSGGPEPMLLPLCHRACQSVAWKKLF